MVGDDRGFDRPIRWVTLTMMVQFDQTFVFVYFCVDCFLCVKNAASVSICSACVRMHDLTFLFLDGCAITMLENKTLCRQHVMKTEKHAVMDDDSMSMTQVITTSDATFARLSRKFQPRKFGSFRISGIASI